MMVDINRERHGVLLDVAAAVCRGSATSDGCATSSDRGAAAALRWYSRTFEASGIWVSKRLDPPQRYARRAQAYALNGSGPKRPHATNAASNSSTTLIATLGSSWRRLCTIAAPTITSISPTAASGTRIGAICSTAGRISPTAPAISARPTSLIAPGFQSAAQPPVEDATSFSLD